MTQPTFNSDLRLGRLVKEYRRSTRNMVMVVVVSLVSAIVASFFFLGAVSMSDDLAGRIVLTIVGLFILLPALFGVYVLVRGRGASLSVFENGMLYREGKTVSTATWDEIESYAQESACRVEKKDGEVIQFGLNIEGVAEVAEKIQEETSNRMIPALKDALRRGETIRFEGLKLPVLSNFARAFSGFVVDQHGISEIDGGEHIRWQDVTEFGVTEEQIGTANRSRNMIEVFFIQDGEKALRTRLGLLKNAHVLLALCAEFVGEEKAQLS